MSFGLGGCRWAWSERSPGNRALCISWGEGHAGGVWDPSSLGRLRSFWSFYRLSWGAVPPSPGSPRGVRVSGSPPLTWGLLGVGRGLPKPAEQ